MNSLSPNNSYLETARRVVYDCPDTATFTAADWVGLALAALDQAGITPRQLNDAYRHARGDTKRVLVELFEISG